MTRIGDLFGAAFAAAMLVAATQASAAPVTSLDPAIGPADPSDTGRALQCLTLALAYEAGYEPVSGMEAVGEVILNRTRRPAFPGSVCGVVFQGSQRRTGCQFTFTCDGALKRTLPAEVMQRAELVAQRVLQGSAPSRVNGATHYHANYVSPYWAPSLVRVARIGLHVFYREPGAADLSVRYRMAGEPNLSALGALPPPDAVGQAPARPLAPPPLPPAKFAPWGLATN